LIQKLLREALQGKKTVLVENDFGEVGVDAALLRAGGVEVRELNAGCICCSLTGDFIRALRELLNRFSPEVVLIEPSGVGKLSDVAKACADPAIQARAVLRRKITVVDAGRCRLYYDNFGEFFTDQIAGADTILLSRAAEHPEKTEFALKLLRSLNGRADILSRPWETLDATALLYPHEHEHMHEHEHEHQHEHQHQHEHEHEHEHMHEHMHEQIFEAVTIRTDRFFSRQELQTLAAALSRATGAVLRAKGLVRGPEGGWNLQYLPGDWRIEPCAAEGGVFCIIGRGLDRGELVRLVDDIPA
jgi:G3E family GTPase